MATRNSKASNMLYSDNPKMDKSGVSASLPEMGYAAPLPGKPITGGRIYMEAVTESANASKKTSMSDPAALRRAAGALSSGQAYCLDHAVDIAQRERLHD